MNFRKHFDYDVKAASDDARTGDFGPSLTVQEHSIDADINEMMRRFKVTGQFPTSVNLPSYGDFEGVTDYQSALHAIMAAQDEFMRLPANVRARFDNNPQLLLEFVSTPGNDRALRELGFTEESVNEYDARIARAAGKAAGGDAAASGAGGGRDGASAGSGS